MQPNDSGPDKQSGSRRDGIDRLAEADKQLRLAMQESDDTWTSEALHALRADLARVRDDGFQRASELHDGLRAHREGQR